MSGPVITPLVAPATGVALRGIAAAGATNSATVISQLARGPAATGAPETRLVTVAEAETRLTERGLATVTHVVLTEPVAGHLVMAIDDAAARVICERLLGERRHDPGRVRSVLEQVGSIASSAFVIAAGRSCGLPFGANIPVVESETPATRVRDVLGAAAEECPHGVLTSCGTSAPGRFVLLVSRWSLPLLTPNGDPGHPAA